MAFESLRLQTIRVVAASDARTARDAMRLAYDGGVESGFLDPNPTGMRFSPSFLNPGTQFIVAYADDEPVASIVSIADGPFGLPSDRAFIEELDVFRAAGDALFEVGAWVIVPEWRGHFAQVAACVFGTAMRLTLASAVPRRMIAVADPHRVRLSVATFGYQAIAGPRPYMHIPGTLIATPPSSEWPGYLLDPDAFAPRRILAERIFDPEPDWLQVGRDGPAWTDVLLPELAEESKIEQRIRAQLDLLRGAQLGAALLVPQTPAA